MPLEDYRKKRDSSKTPEPAGQSRGSRRRGPLFVVQKHHASHLHYDFRLEIDRVLVSWAIPKGPSMNPAEKRLAMMTEDHPLEYARFEGVIPEGEYGAGAVIVWDIGTYETEDETAVRDHLGRGELKVVLHGTKLRGGFVLVHRGKRSSDPARKRRWLLIKHRDESADRAWQIDTPELDRSVLTGRTLEEIAVGRRSIRRKAKAA